MLCRMLAFERRIWSHDGMRETFLLTLILPLLLASCATAPQRGSIRERDATYRHTLGVLGKDATRAQLQRAFPGLKPLTGPRGPADDSVLTGVERFRIDPYFDLEVKFMYAAPYRIAAGATRLGAQAAADEPPSLGQIFGFVREASRGAFAESPHDEVLSTRLLRSTPY